jgi:hypothetical protein
MLQIIVEITNAQWIALIFIIGSLFGVHKNKPQFCETSNMFLKKS